MVSSKKSLITTSIQDTWDFESPTLMLGNWCNTFNNRHLVKNLKENSILEYHWNDPEKVLNDYSYLNEFADKILLKLIDNLNHIHQVNFSKTYWKIILSNWLFTFVHIIYDRWKTIEKAFKEFDIEKTKRIKINLEDVIPQSIENFTDLVHQDKWNHFIFCEILEKNFDKEFKFEDIKELKNDDYSRFNKNRITFNKKILLDFYKLFRSTYSKIFKDDDYFIIESYLGKWNEFLLNLKLKNFPIAISPGLDLFVNPDLDLRKKISIALNTNNEFEDFVIKIIPKLIPCSFLENYTEVKNIVKKSHWPKNPKVIFTSHAINTKTISSFYIAEKKEQGAFLIHGQHGGGYGQCKFHWYEKFEKEISDKFLTWGWSKESDKKNIPFGILKSISNLENLRAQKEEKKKLLLVIRPKGKYFATALDSKIRGTQILDYHLDCIKMANSLNKKIRDEDLVVRLHERKYGWFEKEMWKEEIPNVTIDEGYQPILEKINKSKLVIYTYNSTGYLELMAANLPVLLYWSNKDNPVDLETEKFYQGLKDVKIFHENKESIAKHLEKEWNNIDKWWNSNEVQDIRVKFCEKYAKLNEDKLENLKKLIKNSKT